jgi:putative flippase GtrA
MVMPFTPAVLVALAIGMTTGYFLYDCWVFPGSVRPLAAKIRDFIAVNVLTQAVMLVVTLGLREVALLAGVPAVAAGAGAHLVGIGAGALVSYLGHRAVTFGKRP